MIIGVLFLQHQNIASSSISSRRFYGGSNQHRNDYKTAENGYTVAVHTRNNGPGYTSSLSIGAQGQGMCGINPG